MLAIAEGDEEAGAASFAIVAADEFTAVVVGLADQIAEARATGLRHATILDVPSIKGRDNRLVRAIGPSPPPCLDSKLSR
jgi:hypothetical protein